MRILLIETRSLADIVYGLQLATSIRAQRPDVHLSWIGRETFLPLLRSSVAIDHVYEFRREGGVRGFLRLMREIREQEFDYAFDLQGQLRSGLMISRTRTRHRIGRSDAKEGAGLFYSHAVPLPLQGRHSHRIDILLKFCEVIGLRPELRGAPLFRDSGSINLPFDDTGPAGRPILIFPDSRLEERRWNGFKQLTEMILRDDRSRRVVWAGNKYIPDKDAFNKEQFLNLTGNTGLLSLPSLVSKASWVIANDTGPVHLAAAMGIRTLGIFGPTDPRVSGPYPLTAPGNHVIQAPLGALTMLSPKEVFARFQRLDTPLKSLAGGPP